MELISGSNGIGTYSSLIVLAGPLCTFIKYFKVYNKHTVLHVESDKTQLSFAKSMNVC